jgi:fermentation-respiration switch protein FrsA (DUF1100 family)
VSVVVVVVVAVVSSSFPETYHYLLTLSRNPVLQPIIPVSFHHDAETSGYRVQDQGWAYAQRLALPSRRESPLRDHVPRGLPCPLPLSNELHADAQSQFASLKEHYLDDFAPRFQEAGLAALVYDNRNWGESEGTPRLEVDPYMQQQDYLDAFDYAASLPDVDGERIAYWGSSFSGGNVIVAAAVDKRIKAAVVQCPFVSGDLAVAAFAPMVPMLLAERVGIKRGLEPSVIPIYADSLEAAQAGSAHTLLSDADAYRYMEAVSARGGGGWENKLVAQSLLKMLVNEPKAFIHRITPTPFLMIVPDADVSVPTATQLAAFELAKEPKTLRTFKGGHYDVYSGPVFEENMKLQIEFLKKHL